VPDRSPATDAALRRMAADAAQRIADADADAQESQEAFAAGKFEEYYQQKYGGPLVEKDDGDADSSGGDGEAGG